MTPAEALRDKPTREQLRERLGVIENGLQKWLARARKQGYKILCVWKVGGYRYELEQMSCTKVLLKNPTKYLIIFTATRFPE